MLLRSLLLALALSGVAQAQLAPEAVVPRTGALTLGSGGTITLRLAVGYISAVHLPEPISSIALGDPNLFRAEHSEQEPQIVFLKPLTQELARSNAVIVTKSGRALTLTLFSYGRSSAASEVDFYLDCRSAHALTVIGNEASLGAEAGSRPDSMSTVEKSLSDELMDEEIRLQARLPISVPNGGPLQASIGRSRELGKQTMVAFSLRNPSDAPIELLSPQIELAVVQASKKHRIASDPVPIRDYRMSRRRLAAGERCDGVVIFERPASKVSDAGLQIRFARADQADRPVLLPIPFVANESEESR